MSQEEMVLDYLKNHTGITSMQAFSELGVTRLSAKIFNLKKKGYEIVCFPRECVNRQGKRVKFGEYRLVADYDFK